MLQSAAAVATIFSAVIAFIGLAREIALSKTSGGRRRVLGLNRNERLLILCIILFFLIFRENHPAMMAL